MIRLSLPESAAATVAPMREVVELLEALDLVINRAAAVVGPEQYADLKDDASALRSRFGLVSEDLVLGIVGGTGAGKSSLLNAIAREEVASVSHLRPHTDRPLAWIPRRASPGLRLLLDELGVDTTVEQDLLPHVALIDLPDVDSIAGWHRRVVEQLLPGIDGVIWLFDPEKYRDPIVHSEFLGKLADYGEQFVFVLNKIDRLPVDHVTEVAADLREILADEGFDEPSLFLTAAAPTSGNPEGIEVLAKHLRERLDGKRVSAGKLVADVKTMLRGLGRSIGTWSGSSVNFAERWEGVRNSAALELAKPAGTGAAEDALCQLEDLVAAIAVDVGPVLGSKLRGSFPSPRIQSAVDAANREKAVHAGVPRRWEVLKAPTSRPASAVTAVLDDHLGASLRALLWRRAELGASITFAAVGAEQLAHRYRRG